MGGRWSVCRLVGSNFSSVFRRCQSGRCTAPILSRRGHCSWAWTQTPSSSAPSGRMEQKEPAVTRRRKMKQAGTRRPHRQLLCVHEANGKQLEMMNTEIWFDPEFGWLVSHWVDRMSHWSSSSLEQVWLTIVFLQPKLYATVTGM